MECDVVRIKVTRLFNNEVVLDIIDYRLDEVKTFFIKKNVVFHVRLV